MTQASQLSRSLEVIFRLSNVLLVATVWLSAFLFGMYILTFYAAASFGGDMALWNEGLPGLYDPSKKVATAGIGIHFAAGGIILVLGCIQLLNQVRTRFPKFHRVVGRIYIIASILVAIGGLVFILVKGTIGGTVMDIGFGLYGLLMLVAAVETFRHAVARQMDKHRAWAIRLFALAIGSWLYRMDYGFWFMLADRAGHASDFSGPFDRFMAFFFYLPNLLVAEVFISKRNILQAPILKFLASILLFLATVFLMIGTYFFTRYYWGPAIVSWFASLS